MQSESNVIPRAELIEILTKRDGYFCFLCKGDFSPHDEVTLDHWHPRSKGGGWEPENLRLAHKRCNALKGDIVPNADGTLPALQREPNSAAKRAIARQNRPEICMKCQSGRSLGPDEYCDICGSVAMPFKHPQWAKLAPNDCTHAGIWWCWVCMSGIVDREPAIVDVLDGRELD